MKLVTAGQMQDLDRRTIQECGIPGIVLMENAGRGAAELLVRYFPEVRAGWVAVLAGSGNNGGDGFVIARHLKNWGVHAKVYLFASIDDVKGDAGTNLRIWLTMGGELVEVIYKGDFARVKKEFSVASLMVDAIFGTGLNSEVKGFHKDTISFVNSLPQPVMAVDIPSGLDATSGKVLGDAIQADLTATFGLAKIGQVIEPGAGYVGQLEIIDIGIPRYLIEEAAIKTHLIDSDELDLTLLDPRPAQAHKGDYGHLFVLAGSPGKTGAAAMVCSGALRTGTGLVTLGIPASLNTILEAKLTEAMTEPLPDAGTGYLSADAVGRIKKLLTKKTALALGPGISADAQVQEMILKLIPEVTVPLVIDADGISAIAQRPEILKQCKGSVVLTPHPGEMARLVGITAQQVQADRIGVAKACAASYNCIVVLKGNKTVIAGPGEEVYINPTGNPGMASGGTGDVLTGMIGGLMAQGLPPLEAAQWG
ncbi:MAG: NAD(P)H-hydrate dehydratase, partial [Desulfobacterales bacterium]|nr:NAD(P)H-hydrate dehydratase [Desulfobacterales bacterium]